MDADLQTLIDSGNLTPKDAAILDQLKPGTFCLHKSWGFGQVHSWNLLLNQIVIDFQTKKQHVMQPKYATDSLQPLREDHILVRKALDPGALKAQAGSDIPAFFETLLSSFGGKITPDQIQRVLTPDLLPEAEFKKWWDNAKKVLRKDGRFSIPTKKTEPITIRDRSISYADELVQQFQQARQLKTQVGVLEKIAKNSEVFAGEIASLQPVVTQVDEIAGRNIRLNPALAIELLIVCDELLLRFPDLAAGSLSVVQLLQEHQARLPEIISQIAATKQRRVLNDYLEAFPSDWDTRLLHALPHAGSRVVGEIAKIFVEQDRKDQFYQWLVRGIREHSISSEVLTWLAKERGAIHFSDLVGPDLIPAILSALERDQFGETRRNSKLHDLLIDDKELIPEIIAQAEIPQARDLMRRLMSSPAFEELNRRSLMARMIKIHPDLQTMLTGETDGKDEALIVSWASLQKRKEEYDELVTKKIPENTKEIGIARSYGDLRENFEFKAAKEMQTVLMRRKAELEQMLERARGSSFENVDTQKVSVGTVVTVRDLETDSTVTYSILGAWDSEPERGILSYQTALGQALLGKHPGEVAELPTESGSRRVEIIEISAYRDLAVEEDFAAKV
ncbi:MAG: GreA/GreB family elongation factor [Chthoniobacterales bacterium]